MTIHLLKFIYHIVRRRTKPSKKHAPMFLSDEEWEEIIKVCRDNNIELNTK